MKKQTQRLAGCVLVAIMSWWICPNGKCQSCQSCYIDTVTSSASKDKFGFEENACGVSTPPKRYLEKQSYYSFTRKNIYPDMYDAYWYQTNNSATYDRYTGVLSNNYEGYRRDSAGVLSEITNHTTGEWNNPFGTLEVFPGSYAFYTVISNYCSATYTYDRSQLIETNSNEVYDDTLNITILNSEYTDSMLRDDVASLVPPYSTNWASGTDRAVLAIDSQHYHCSFSQIKYRFKIPPRTITNQVYTVHWDIYTFKQYDYQYGTNAGILTIETNCTEQIVGTGNPTNFAYGAEHELVVSDFYDTCTNGGTVTKWVQVTAITEDQPRLAGSVNEITSGSTGGCSQCGVGGHLGRSAISFGQLSLGFSLGSQLLGKPAGELSIRSAGSRPSLATPGGLIFNGDINSVSAIMDNNGQLRQVLAPQALADIVTIDPYAYEIRYYFASQVGNQSGGLYQTTGSPFVTWRVENPNTNNFDSLQLTETRGNNGWVYNYIYSSANNSWTRVAPGATSQEQTVTAIHPDGSYTMTNIVSQTNGPLAQVTARTYRNYSWGEALVQETTGAGSDAKTTIRTYYDATDFGYYPPNGSFVPLKMVLHPDGSWEYYTYTVAGGGIPVRSAVYSAFGDAPAPQNGVSGDYRVTVYDYSSQDSSDDLTQEPLTPRKITETIHIGGMDYMVSQSSIVLSPGTRQDIQSTGGYSHQTTTTTYYRSGPNQYRVQSVANYDGSMSFYDYAQSTNGWQTNTISTGQPNSGQTAIADGTQTTTILDSFGQTVSVTVKDIVSQAIIGQEVYGNFDELSRAQQVVHLDGTTNAFNFGCCYLESAIDRDGVVTVYLHDAGKREYGRQIYNGGANPITYNSTLDAAGRSLQSIRYGTDNSSIVQSQSGYDTAGQLIAQTNALNGPTTYVEYNDGTTGGLVRTTTYPDGGTRIEAYYVDGSLKSVTGSGVHGVRYEYGAGNDDLGNACSYTKEIKLNASGSDSSEWTKTFTDMAGRTTEILYADGHYSQSFYNSQGQLWKQVDPDGVTMLYTYNGKGEQVYTIVALNSSTQSTTDYSTLLGNLSTILAGTDRVTWTTNDVTTDHGTTVRRSRTYAWTQNSVNSSTLLSMSETSVDGLSSWQVNYCDGTTSITNQSITSISGSGRTTINTAPDGSYTINTYSYGRLLSSTRYDSNGTQIGGVSYSCDAHGRQYQVTDVRNGATTYGYNNADQVNTITTPNPGNGGLPETTTTLYDNMMRPYSVTQPDGTTVNSEYLLTGEMGLQFGSRTYPVAYGFDYAGRMIKMTNWSSFNGGSGSAGARVTTWNYDSQRGWLNSKAYNDGHGPSYNYTSAGRLHSRAWVRGVNTTYAYSNAGSLTNILYSDSTPAVTNTYDRLGRLSTTTCNGITDALAYNLANELLGESYSGSSLNGLMVTNVYDSLLRRSSLALKNGSSTLASTAFGYDNASRLSTVDDGNGDTATYSYLANSPLVSQIAFKQSGATRMTTSKQYDYLNRLTSISSTPSGSEQMPINFNYNYNSANQRTKNTLADGSYWVYQYDSLGQVTNGCKYFADGTLVPGQQLSYLFDDIGNRKQTVAGGDASGGNKRLALYNVNDLNQITARDYPGTNDIIGAALSTNTVAVNGQTAWRKGEYFWATVSSNNTASAQWEGVSVISSNLTNSGHLLVPQTPQNFLYDLDGNLVSDGLWTNVWDAESRMISSESSAGVPPTARMREEWSYLPDGRWSQRIVSSWNGSTYIPQYTNKFVWDGKVIAAIVDHTNGMVMSFMRGSDLSGSMQGAGGTGGVLLSQIRTNSTQFAASFYAFDGNGNVAALISAAGGTVNANYDYAAFGEPLRITGSLGLLNPIRFSTQFADEVRGIVKYLYREYVPSTGTWPSKDPIGEDGGKNLYGFVGNAPCFNYDLLGMKIEAASCTLDEYLNNLGFVLGTDYTQKYVGDDSLYTGFTANKTGEGEAVIIQQMMRSDYVFKVPGKTRAAVEKNIKENVATRLKVISNARGLKTRWGGGTFATLPPALSDDPADWQAWYDANNNSSVLLYCRKSTFLAFYGAIGGPSHELTRSPPEKILIPGDWYFIRNVAFDQDPGWQNTDATFAGENTIVVGLNGAGEGILWGLMGSSVERPLQDWNADIIQNWQTMSGAKTPANPQPAWTKSPMNGLGK